MTVQTIDEVPALDEDDETFTVTLSGQSSHASIADGSGTGTITDDDPEPSIASISDATVAEGNTGTVDATITVTLSAASGKTDHRAVRDGAGNGDARAPTTRRKSGNLVFAPGKRVAPSSSRSRATRSSSPDEKFSVGTH